MWVVSCELQLAHESKWIQLWRSFWCHTSCWVHGAMALPRYYKWRHFYPEEPQISRCVFCVHGSKNAWDIWFLKEQVRKNTLLCPVVNWFKSGNDPKLLADVSSLQTSGDPRNPYGKSLFFFGRPDVITYSSMINGYAKVWLGLGRWSTKGSVSWG